VNLQLDVANPQKVENYIPTRSSLQILKQYLRDTVEGEHGNATVLIGPYGKGKSHLILVWLALHAGETSKEIKNLIKRIEVVDKDAASMAKKAVDEKKKYLPVLVTNTENELNHAFLYGLYEALQKAGLENVTPDSYYSEAIKTIENWRKNYKSTYEQLGAILSQKDSTIDALCSGLSKYDKKALQLFKQVYPKLTAGSVFEPILQQEALKVYQSVNRTLKEEYGYDGIAIIFDEFSKYIEGHGTEHFAADMKVLQEMCELASGSKKSEGKVQLVLIAHKSIKEYGIRLEDKVRKEFEGVEGRLQERLFVISSQNNYELIRNTIHKNPSTENVFNQESFRELYKKSFELQAFHGVFEKEKEFADIIAKGCFPLTPLATYLLLGISEKVAQNERTIFTFLTYEEYGSLPYLIAQHKAGEDLYIGSDSVYDYFQLLFKENVSDVRIHNEWLKADYALTKAISEYEKKVIKTIALIHMIGKPDEISADERTLACGVYTKENIRDILLGLEKKQLIIYRARTNQYDFRNNIGIDLEKEIANKMALVRGKYALSDVMQEISERDYLLPRRHNQQKKLTRYFRYLYMSGKEYIELPSEETLFQDAKFADGYILCVFYEDDTEKAACKSRSLEIKDPRVFVLLPTDSIKFEKKIERYLVIRDLLKSPEFVGQHQVLRQELTLQLDDVIYEVNEELNKWLSPVSGKCELYHQGELETGVTTEEEFNRAISDVCETYYQDTPIINHELVNIRNVSGQYLKARNTVITYLLNGTDCSDLIKGTSPESMVFRSTLLYTGIYQSEDSYEMDPGTKAAIQEIQGFFKKSSGKKQSFQKLFAILLGKGYGMRQGVIPIYLTSQLMTLSNMPVVYLQDKEVDVTAEILNNICERPAEYSLYIEKKDAKKDNYLKGIEKIFGDDEASLQLQGKHRRLSQIIASIQRWYRSLPQHTIRFEKSENQYSQEELNRIRGFRDIFRKPEVNPREVLFDYLPKVLSEKADYDEAVENLGKLYITMKQFLEAEKKVAVQKAKKVYGFKAGETFSVGIVNWYRNQSDVAKTYINSSRVSRLMNYLSALETNDDQVVISDLSKILIDIYPEDWNDNSIEDLIDTLIQVKAEIERIGDRSDDDSGEYSFQFKNKDGEIVKRSYDFTEDDSTSYFLKNAIESALDDFGDSLETNQKVAVLIQTIEQLIKKK